MVQPRAVVPGGLQLDDGDVVEADHIVTVADIVARPLPGLPSDRAGFVPVDAYGHVVGEPCVYAAGEATAFPLRQGGVAAQQADVVAEAIAARCAPAGPSPRRSAPVLRARLTTSGAPLSLFRPAPPVRASPPIGRCGRHRRRWPAAISRPTSPPRGRAGSPPRRSPSGFPPRPPRPAGTAQAIALALTLAAAEERCHNRSRALQALEAARALDPDLCDPLYVELRDRLADEVPAV